MNPYMQMYLRPGFNGECKGYSTKDNSWEPDDNIRQQTLVHECMQGIKFEHESAAVDRVDGCVTKYKTQPRSCDDDGDEDLLSDSNEEPPAEAARPALKTAKPRARLPNSAHDGNSQPAVDSSDEGTSTLL
mmetsp:Transcript_44520/g.110821  ORF Transcript_44520/g.110821 Transcript_44520/m.110821 type:complete len:131 (+) Transcript_44520:130-522(+)